jgi:tRNA nucleotidyltransferase (CCA-adding enzyme)
MEVRDELNKMIEENKVAENVDTFLAYVPEARFMVDFDQMHPHHNLDVWEHTLKVLDDLKDEDLELKIAGLFHDIGKPFSYQQDGEIRHFKGHPEYSTRITRNVLNRLGYEQDTIKNVCYLVKSHDTVIDVNNLDNNLELVKKRLRLQYADARAHTPSTVQKRIDFLDNIKGKLERVSEKEKDEVESR